MENTHQLPESRALYDSDIEIKYSTNQESPKRTTNKAEKSIHTDPNTKHQSRHKIK